MIDDQTVYVQGSNITTSVRKVLDPFKFVENESSERAMLFADFEKAFDSIEQAYKVFEKSNFGKQFIKMMKYYNGPYFKVKNNSWLSNHCRIERGVRQGCSLSALLFVIAVYVFAIMIRTDKKYKWCHNCETAQVSSIY